MKVTLHCNGGLASVLFFFQFIFSGVVDLVSVIVLFFFFFVGQFTFGHHPHRTVQCFCGTQDNIRRTFKFVTLIGQ